jgi:hypothetical protein
MLCFTVAAENLDDACRKIRNRLKNPAKIVAAQREAERSALSQPAKCQ